MEQVLLQVPTMELVMLRYFLSVFCLLGTLSWGKIYVCLPFFNEYEILEMHLHEIYDLVDHFVISECNETFSGNPKPYYFEENKERFARFSDKIIHVKFDRHIKTNDPEVRDKLQKGWAISALEGCDNDDIIVVADCDEIISRDAFNRGLKELKEHPEEIVFFEQRCHRYFLNRVGKSFEYKSVMSYYPAVRRLGIEGMRAARINNSNMRIVKDGGWHLTSMGSLEKVRLKFQSFAHVDWPEFKKAIKDIEIFRLEELEKNFSELKGEDLKKLPTFARENPELIEEWGLMAPEGFEAKARGLLNAHI